MYFGEPFGGVIPGAQGAVLAAALRTAAPMTGRQIHALVNERHSLWSVQQALRDLTSIGLIDTQRVGRAGVHTVNERHVAVPPLRALLDPIAALTTVIGEVADGVRTVILFGSVARGQSDADSDIDLAVLAPKNWPGRADLADNVRDRLGNRCEVLVFTPSEFAKAAARGEPVIADIMRDGIPLVGTMPRAPRGVASA